MVQSPLSTLLSPSSFPKFMSPGVLRDTTPAEGGASLNKGGRNKGESLTLADAQALLQQRIQAKLDAAPEAQGRSTERMTATKVSANILGFIERQLERDLAQGATQEQLASRLEAGLEGFNKGFNQAREQLEALGQLSPYIEADIGNTHRLVTAGIEDMADRFGLAPTKQTEPVSANPDVTRAVAARYDYAAAQSFQFELVTAEGDRVQISASARQNQSVRAFSDEQGTGFASRLGLQSGFELSLQGDLNQDELAAIDSLLGQVTDLSQQFFEGDLEAAFQTASELGYDDTQISAFALNLTRVEVQRASVAYADTGPTRGNLQNQLAPLGQFIKDLNSALDTAQPFAQPQALLKDMIDTLFGDETRPGNQDGRRFGNLVERLLNL